MIGSTAFAVSVLLLGTASATAQPLFDWSGFYVGANAGYGWGRSGVSMPAVDPSFTIVYRTFFLEDRTTLKPNGFLGGAQAGYNVQTGSFLWGLEGDAQYMRLKSSRDTGFIPGPFPLNPAHNVRYQENLSANNFFTLRLRGGVVAGPSLFFGTAGLAVTRVAFSRDITVQGGATHYPGSTSSTKAGWTVGGGLEYAIAPGWTAKAEYLYADFGSVGFRAYRPLTTSFIDSKAKLSTHILRFGINRKL
jgi:outer membrane immunogenic protein